MSISFVLVGIHFPPSPLPSFPFPSLSLTIFFLKFLPKEKSWVQYQEIFENFFFSSFVSIDDQLEGPRTKERDRMTVP